MGATPTRYSITAEEYELWNEALDRYESGDIQKDGSLKVLNTTPAILVACGLPNNPIYITKRILDKITGKILTKSNERHGVPIKELRGLQLELDNPIAVFDSETDPNSSVILTRIVDKQNNEKAIVVLKADVYQGQTVMNAIASAYGKSKPSFESWIAKRRLRYINKQARNTSAKWLQLPGDSVLRARSVLTENNFSKELLGIVTHPSRSVNTKNDTKMLNAAHRRAIENGHIEAAKRLVYEAAERAGYKRKVFHETDADVIHVFDLSIGTHAATDSETPYGIFTKSTNAPIGLGKNQMELLVKANNTLEVNDRSEVAEKIPELVPYYDKLKEIDEWYTALHEESEEREFTAMEALQVEHPDADMDKVYPTENIAKGLPANIDSEAYREAFAESRRIMDEWRQKYDEVAVKCKEIITSYLRDNGYDSMYFSVDDGSFGRKTDTLILLDTNQIKSADPFTYDDAGNLIPLSERFNMKTDDIRFSISSDRAQAQREYDEVVAQYKNTDQWLKAPNGKATNLTERQWVQVRTPSFKKWFGDWENSFAKDFLSKRDAVAKLIGDEFSKVKGKTLTDQVEEFFKNIGGKAVSPIFREVVLDRRGADDSLAHGMGRMKAVAYAAVKDVIEYGIVVDYDVNHKDRGYDSALVAAPVEIGGVRNICVVGIRKNRNENRFYLHEVTQETKLLEEAFVTNLGQNPASNQGVIKTILKRIYSVNPDSASKVVDENGEPLVVYRGAPYDPLAQEEGKGVISAERYFTPDEKYAKRYEKGEGVTRAYFLNVRSPFDVRNERDAERMLELRGGHKFHTGVSGALDWAEAPDAEEINDLYEGEYDGLILDEGGDPSESGAIHRGISFVPFEGGVQVKSATDNVGTFDEANPDIRFSIVSKDGYLRKAEWAAKRMAANKEIGMKNGLTEDQADALEALASVRHKMHTSIDNLVRGYAEDVEEELVRVQNLIEEVGLKSISLDTSMIDSILVLEELEDDSLYTDGELDDEKYDEVYARIYGEYEDLNREIESYLGKIDEQYGTQYRPTGATRYSIGGLYTGSAADYAQPSLHYVGTGEGAQVYGWGLYASNDIGVADWYAKMDVNRKKKPFDSTKKHILINGVHYEYRKGDWDNDESAAKSFERTDGKKVRIPQYKLVDVVKAHIFLLNFGHQYDTREAMIQELLADAAKTSNASLKEYCETIANILKEYAIEDIKIERKLPSEHLYEQTFFTNRPEGDESHLLLWRGEVTDEQRAWVMAQLDKEFTFGEGEEWMREVLDESKSGEQFYLALQDVLVAKQKIDPNREAPKAASEFLARAGIDGVKYPVGSHRGPVQDGDKVGWNYVSFRDDNIRVDHKWVDGEQRYSVGAATEAEFKADPNTSDWVVYVEPSYIRTMRSHALKDLKPVTESLDNNSVEKAIKNLFTEFGKVTNTAYDYTVVFNRADAGKMMMQSGVNMRTFAPQMKALFETAVHAFDNPQKMMAGHKFHKNVLGFKHFVNKFKDGEGKEYYVRFTVREEKGGRKGVHAATVSDVTVYEAKNAATVSANESEGQYRVFTDKILAKFLSKGNQHSGADVNENRLSVAARRPDLVGVHNMSAEGLKGADALGGTRFSVVLGERGAANLQINLNAMDNLSVAKQMLGDDDWTTISKEQKQKIKRATGWEKGADGKWRYEWLDFKVRDIEGDRRTIVAKMTSAEIAKDVGVDAPALGDNLTQKMPTAAERASQVSAHDMASNEDAMLGQSANRIIAKAIRERKRIGNNLLSCG